jgi:hypothetical protein
MGRRANTESRRGDAPPHATACERVLRYLRLAGFGRGGRRVRIHAAADHGTHWYLTFAVSSLEDPSRDFMSAGIVAEKETGFVYSFPSRSRQPIDATDIASIRQSCTRITPDDLDELEAEERRRGRGPTCFICGSSNVHCNGGRVFHVAGLDGEFVQWVHTCRDCGRELSDWV